MPLLLVSFHWMFEMMVAVNHLPQSPAFECKFWNRPLNKIITLWTHGEYQMKGHKYLNTKPQNWCVMLLLQPQPLLQLQPQLWLQLSPTATAIRLKPSLISSTASHIGKEDATYRIHGCTGSDIHHNGIYLSLSLSLSVQLVQVTVNANTKWCSHHMKVLLLVPFCFAFWTFRGIFFHSSYCL